MKKNFTKINVALAFVLGLANAHAQTFIWPTADTNTINASQFNRATSILPVFGTDSVPPTHTGWSTRGLLSSVAAKKDSALWSWATTTKGFIASGGRIVSPTVANGAACFDSDFLDNRGVSVGTGQAPSTSAAMHSGELVSPIINATGYTDISVKFNQYYYNFNAKTYITWSEDSGRTWKPRVQINTKVSSITASNAVVVTKLVGSVGTSKFKIKLVYEGYYYWWLVDDVQLLDISQDLQLDPFFSIAPSYITPKNQTENMKFMLDIRNVGRVAMPNTKVKLDIGRVDRTVTPPTYTSIYKDSLSYGTVAVGALIENKILPGTFLATAYQTVGEYQGNYTISSDLADHNTTNNLNTFTFFVNDTAYQKDANNGLKYYTLGGRAATDLKPLVVGNYYYLPKGKGTTITTLAARISSPNTLIGKTLGARLYTWTDLNADELIQPDERVLVAVADSILPAGSPTASTTYNFPLRDLNTQKWFYANDTTQYLATLEYEPTAATDPAIYPGFSVNNNDYAANVFLTDSLYRTGVTGFKPRFGPILGKSSSVEWSTATFTGQAYSAIPVVRLTIMPFRVKNDELAVDNKLELYPNPAMDVVTLAVDLPKASAAAVRIMTTTGNIVAETIYSNVQKEQLSIDVSELASGTYLLQFLTPDGMRTKKLTIVK
ncbi:MAG: hypothetical protein RIS64_56 [Bacteroidota bacterium]|jgi:hypothetical protein